MAAPISGRWASLNANAADYSGALKWGTGASQIYADYGAGPPLGVTGRPDGPDTDDVPYHPVPEELLAGDGLDYGYTMEDVMMTSDDAFMEGVPSPNERPETTRMESGTYPPPSWMARPNGPSGGYFRSVTQPGLLEDVTEPHSYPTETVTEGWDNKLAGEVLHAETSNQVQYERQTSMQQLDPEEGRNNGAAVARGTDDARANIRTRLTGMKIKPWSEGQRTEDMFPYQQDLILRPFWFRNAQTGPQEWLTANEFQAMTPIQRTPPSEPNYGPQESAGNVGPDFGYAEGDYYG